MIERHEVRTFNAIVEEGGFSRAAEKLNVSQSAVSQTIANLEHRLSTRLLIRGKKPELTEAGKRLFTYARTVINEEQLALDDIEHIRTGDLSTLNLAMNSMVNRIYGSELLLGFCEDNPLTRLQLDVAPSQAIIYGVDEDRWELGFGPFRQQMPGHFALHPYLGEERVLVVHEDHPRAAEIVRDPLTVLAETVLLTSYLDESPRRTPRRLRDHFQAVWEVGNLELRLALAAAGKGVTYLSDRLLDSAPGMQVIENAEIGKIQREVGVFHKKHRALSEGARRFLAICERRFANR
jgi:DNA-binding transcriptional LysR family regulator